MKFIASTVATLAALLMCAPLKAQTPEQWTQWGTVVHGGFGSLIAYGIGGVRIFVCEALRGLSTAAGVACDERPTRWTSRFDIVTQPVW